MQDLVNQVVKRGKIKTFGNSMFPILRDQDTVHIKKISFNRIKTNDIVCFKKNSHLITHRVLYKTNKYLITKGDNNRLSDGKIRPERIIGLVDSIQRGSHKYKVEDLYLMQSSLYFDEIRRIAGLFMEHKIDFVILKGLPLHLLYEGKYPSRIYADCDILIHKKQFKKVKKLLFDNSYKMVTPTSLTGKTMLDKAEISFYKNVNGLIVTFDIHLEIVFLMTSIGKVEKLYPQQLVDKLSQKFIYEKEYIEIERVKFPVLKIENLIIYLLLHIYHHNFEGGYRYQFMREVFKKKINYYQILNTIKEYKLWNFIYSALFLYVKYYDRKRIKSPFYKGLRKISNANLVERKFGKTNIFDEKEILGEGNFFRVLFSLSPNPLWIKIFVFLNGTILYSLLWVINRKTKRFIMQSFPFLRVLLRAEY